MMAARGAPSRAPRVLITADAVGGVWTYALDLAAGLSQAGVMVVLAVLGPAPDAASRARTRAIAGLELVETGLPLDWTATNAAQLAQASQGVARLALERAVDLVHLNSPVLAADADYAAPVVGVCHSCLATWWAAVRGGEPPADFVWRVLALRRGLAACDQLIAPSRAFAEQTGRAHGLARPPRVVANGRPLPAAPRAAPTPQVFTAGRLWDVGKNLTTLDAAAGLIDAPVMAAGAMAGPNGETATLQRLTALGPVSADEIDAWLARRPVFASLALYEPFGLAVLEAAGAGCPLVLSDIPTFRELWDGAAVFVPPTDVEAAAAALRTLTQDAAPAGRWGALARRRASRFSVAAMTEAMLAVYAELAPDRFAARPEAAA